MLLEAVNRVTVFSPAKLNLFLAILGPRSDGYHALLSVAAPLGWGDELTAEEAEDFSLECDDPAVPLDSTNLILRAAAAFRAASGWRGGAKFRLEKRIPIGAGLGGGSSNGVAALRALSLLSGDALEPGERRKIAASLGSDCPLFLSGEPAVMRGRGEETSPLAAEAARRIRGRRVLVFKPDFGISTAWAYGRMRREPSFYLGRDEAEEKLARWIGRAAPAEELLFNSMEGPAFAKFPALPLLLERLRGEFGLAAAMSGSGSACFALLPEGGRATVERVAAAVRSAWGGSARVVATEIG